MQYQAARLKDDCVYQLLTQTCLASGIVEGIFGGRQLQGFKLAELFRSVSADRNEQRRTWVSVRRQVRRSGLPIVRHAPASTSSCSCTPRMRRRAMSAV